MEALQEEMQPTPQKELQQAQQAQQAQQVQQMQQQQAEQLGTGKHTAPAQAAPCPHSKRLAFLFPHKP